jgi:hypothetical protein
MKRREEEGDIQCYRDKIHPLTRALVHIEWQLQSPLDWIEVVELSPQEGKMIHHCHWCPQRAVGPVDQPVYHSHYYHHDNRRRLDNIK